MSVQTGSIWCGYKESPHHCAYFDLFAFSSSFLKVPSFLSLLMSLPFGCLKDPEGMPSFFSRLPIRISLLICLAIVTPPFYLPKTRYQRVQNCIASYGKQATASTRQCSDCNCRSLRCPSDYRDCTTNRSAHTNSNRDCAEYG